jgi:hypothetical protein
VKCKGDLFLQPLESFTIIAANGQGLLQGWNSLLVRPGPLLNKDIKVQVNKQKPGDVSPAQMKLIAIKCPIALMSCQPCSKPDVMRRRLLSYLFGLFV